jgi:peptidoglycan-N-acetylglucosamine deacetylase
MKLKYYSILLALTLLMTNLFSQDKPSLSITIDDPTTESTAGYDWKYKDSAILNTLDKYGIIAALFVCGKRINREEGNKLLENWNNKNHLICNHSYSHSYFHSSKISLTDFEEDFLVCDSIIRKFSNYTKLFRFPYLKEGNTIEKRDGFRNFLSVLKYKTGCVTIDASDWYIDGRMRDTLKSNPGADLAAYKEYYLNHIYDRAVYYNNLSRKLTGRNIKHTLLLHHNLLNAMFLGDLIEMFMQKGWEKINASDAFTDEIYNTAPDILPAGESLIWAIAKQSGKYENSLRYPGEDGEYEVAPFNEFIKSYKK